jgi:hypothetical protein
MASPISFLQLSLFLAAAFDFLAWSKSTVSLQTPSSHLLLCFPNGLLLPKVLHLDLEGGFEVPQLEKGFQSSNPAITSTLAEGRAYAQVIQITIR